ncbi:MAG: hypothetical protein KTR30_21095 [Saprospiraceae bacterium]|nr:hypothetical protein [Saprospiraceae bacterium]
MIDHFKLVYHQFEPIRESLSSTYSYQWANQVVRYQIQREGRINEEQQGEFPLPEGASLTLHHFLLTHDLYTNRNIKHNPYHHPSAFQGADGLDIEIECKMEDKSIRQCYRGTSVQLESYAGALHELWRLVHRYIP